MKFLVILSFLISLKACQSSHKALSNEDNKIHISATISGAYQVETLNNHTVSENKLIINFDPLEKHISGFSGCNRFMGNYSLKSDSIKIGPLASTRMFCEETHQIESDMQEALSKTDKIVLTDTTLQLLSNKKVILTAIKKNDQISFNYSAISRGHFLEIHLNDSVVSLSKDRKEKPVSKPLKKETWKKLNTLLETINLDSISTLKSPTEARFYDGASIAKLVILKNGTPYESSSFDHGKPPMEIEALVKEILSISENIE